jgi:hypothetical protein
LTDNPEHPGQSPNPQDENLEAQLDELIGDLEAVDPQSVPPDLRKNKSEPEAEPAPAAPEPVEAAQDEPQPVPAVPEASDEAGSPPKQELDIESVASMAANLLDQQIESTIESASQVKDDAPAEPVPATPEPAVSGATSNDELGDQIQALLDDIQSQGAEPEPEPAAAEEPQPEPAPAEPQPVAAAPVDEPDADSGAVSIEQIDAMLAESAEQALESEPEAPEHVPGTDEILAAQAEAEAAEAAAKASVEAEAGAIEEATPPQPAQAFEAGAEDVARELDADEQAEPAPAAAEPQASDVFASAAEPQAEPTAEAVPESAAEPAETEAPAVVVDKSALQRAERSMLRVCYRINRPVQRLSPEIRNTVGYVGVLTTGVGAVLFLYGVLF